MHDTFGFSAKKTTKNNNKSRKMREIMGMRVEKKRYIANEHKEKLWVSKRALVAIYGA